MITLRTGCRDLPLPLPAHLGARVFLSPPDELQDERVDVRGPGACLLLVSSEGRSLSGWKLTIIQTKNGVLLINPQYQTPF